MHRAFLGLLLFVVPITLCAADNRHSFSIYNRGYHVITSVYIVDPSASEWGDDLLYNDQTIDINEHVTFTLSSDCDQYVRIDFADHQSRYWRPIDTCSMTINTTH